MDVINEDQFKLQLTREYTNLRFSMEQIIKLLYAQKGLFAIGKALSRNDGIILYNSNTKKTVIDANHEKFQEVFNAKQNEMLVCDQLIISACSIFEFYVLGIIKVFYLKNPKEILAKDQKGRKEQTITYAELINGDSLEKIITDIIEIKVSKLSYNSIEKNLRRLAEIEKSVTIDDSEIQSLSDIYQIRNIIVHNKGIVNELFLLNTYFETKDQILGRRVKLDFDLMDEYITLMNEVGFRIIKEIC